MRIGSRVRGGLLAALVAVGALVWTGEASAAVGDLTFASCTSQDGSAGDCTDVPGSAFDGAADTVFSPDGKSLYVGSFRSDSVSHFLVGASGELTFGGCVSNDGSGGQCTDLPGSAFDSPSTLEIRPDGDSLYVASTFSNSVTDLSVDSVGQLTFGGCVSEDGSGGICANVPGSAFKSVDVLQISPDGDSLYVGAANSGSVNHFFVAPAGQIVFGGCASFDGSGGTCADVPGDGLRSPSDLAISPDGDSLYVVAAFSEALTRFSAAPAGQITFGDCVSQSGSGGLCADIPGSAFDSPIALAISPDGASLYVASVSSDSVSRFSAAPGGQLTFGDCISRDGSAGLCTTVPGSAFVEATSIAISPAGDSVYVGAFESDSLSTFSATPGGRLSFSDCVSNDGSGGSCTNLPGSVLLNPSDIEVSPDGASVYVAAPASSSVDRFARVPSDTAPTPTADTTPPELTLTIGKATAGKAVKVTVSCDEACSVDITGEAKPKGSKQGNLKPASADLGAGRSATLELKPKGKLRKALRRRGKGKATLAATATDASGNSADATERVKLK